MILVALRSRLRPEREAEYRAMAAEVGPLATAVPGYLGHKSFTAEDGERVTLVEYESEAAMQVWARDPVHRRVKIAGRQDFFSEYRLQVCSVLRDSRHQAKADASAEPPAVGVISREKLAIRAMTREELDRHIARAEALRHAAYAAAFAAIGRALQRMFGAICGSVVWTARVLRPNWLHVSTGDLRHGKCRA